MNAPAEPIWWNSKEGRKRLFESAYAQSFFTLAHLFERQMTPSYCGVASAIMVLNALRLRKKNLSLETKFDIAIPEELGGGRVRYNSYTQQTFFDDELGQDKDRNRVQGKVSKADDFNPGYCLGDLAKQLRTHLLDVKEVEATSDEKAITRFRHDLMAHLNASATFILSNFESGIVGREGGGHFSPVVAYHPESDSCLVLDVAGHKNPWFWTPVALLYQAMHTRDGACYRGYLIVSDRLDA